MSDAIIKWYSENSLEITLIPKEVLFRLMYSHSKLAQAEYHRNLAYTDAHFSAVAEKRLIEILPVDVINQFFVYIEVQNESNL